MRRSKTVIGALLLITTTAVGSESFAGKEAGEEALSPPAIWSLLAAVREGLWADQSEKLLPILEQLTAVAADNGELWIQLAETSLALGQLEKAIAALHQVRALGFVEPAESAYRLAKAHVLAGEVDEARQWLSTSLAEGHRFRERALADPVFEALLDDAQLVGLQRPLPAAKSDRVTGWRTDVDYLVGEIRRLHYIYKRQALPDAFVKQAARLRAQVPSWTDQQIVLEIQRLLATLGDGHTVVLPFGMKRGALKRLPIGLWFFSDGLYVIRSGAELVKVGSRVIAIGELEVEELYDRLSPWVSHDNPSGFRWVAPVYLTFVDYLRAVGVTAEQQGQLLLEEPGGRLRMVSIEPRDTDPREIPLGLIPPPAAEAPLYLQALHQPFRSLSLDEGAVLYVQMNRVTDGERQTLADFGRDLRRKSDDGNFTTLILDLRHNPGGDAGLLREIVRALVHFETTRSGRRIFVLMSRNTFSAAQTLLNLAEQLTDAIFIGEPSGTRPNRLGNEAPFRLPFSGVQGTLASGYNQAATSRDHRLWIAPDVGISLSSRDYFAGRDPALEAILRMIRRNP